MGDLKRHLWSRPSAIIYVAWDHCPERHAVEPAAKRTGQWSHPTFYAPQMAFNLTPPPDFSGLDPDRPIRRYDAAFGEATQVSLTPARRFITRRIVARHSAMGEFRTT